MEEKLRQKMNKPKIKEEKGKKRDIGAELAVLRYRAGPADVVPTTGPRWSLTAPAAVGLPCPRPPYRACHRRASRNTPLPQRRATRAAVQAWLRAEPAAPPRRSLTGPAVAQAGTFFFFYI